MKFVSNAGTDRVLDLVRLWLKADNGLDMVSPTLSLFAFAEVLADAAKLSNARVVLPAGQAADGGGIPRGTLVLRDANLTAILQQHGITQVQSLLAW